MVHLKPVFASLLLLCSMLLISCGGGDSEGSADSAHSADQSGDQSTIESGDDSEGGYGLEQREALAELNLPQSGSALSSYAAVNAYPNLSFNAVLYAASVPGEQRIAIAEQAGVVKVFADDSEVTESKVVLDISNRVILSGEEGLIGMAFDPNFVQNRYVYLHYSSDNPLRSVISRFTWDQSSDQIDEATEKVILTIEQPFHNHNAGALAFGPDGYLYIASGDGGSGGDPFDNGQSLNSLLGKLLRVDVHPDNPSSAYDIPANNPFVGNSAARPEIYAYGLRNPFRFSFDRQTGELWLGDVGQEAYEEIDLVVAGGNYGWRYMEGNSIKNELPAGVTPDSFEAPVYVYDHSHGVAVIGGYVYRGNAVPSLIGRYLYADFSSGTVWALTWDGQKVVSNDAIVNVVNPSSFAEKSDGEVLIVSRYGGLFKLIDTAPAPGGELPARLSETGIFTDLASMTPAQGFVEYLPNHPFWSDGVSKRRWVGVPLDSKVTFSDDNWTFPIGTVTVKHFEYNLVEGDSASVKKLETRILYNTYQGWQGFTYKWNTQGTDADLLTGRETVTLSSTSADGSNLQQLYEFPSQADCLRCHTQIAGWTLGLSTPQLNGDFDYTHVVDNQIRSWNHVGYFDYDVGGVDQYSAFSALGDASASVESRARAYLDVNCSVCHQPGGSAAVSVDLRAGIALDAMNAVGVAPESGNLDIDNAMIIAAGEKERSVLWQRMKRLDDQRMPPLSSHRVDQVAVDLLGEWIDSMER